MANTTDLTAKLPDGNLFDFWEVDQAYEREIHVNNQIPVTERMKAQLQTLKDDQRSGPDGHSRH